MATTTNFGWETPDDTDLVKDGAAAIRTALGGVDTSFVDLKGGTTGQVLAKASNTDLDYSWVAVDPLVILDAKGDLISATAADTPARLAVGANDTVLTADSTTATGLKWAAPASGGMTLLSTTAITNVSSISLSSINQGYKNLQIYMENVTLASPNEYLQMTFNGVTTSTYSYSYLQNATTQSAGNTANIQMANQFMRVANSGNGMVDIQIPNYANTSSWKTCTFSVQAVTGGPTVVTYFGAGGTNNTAAITSIELKTSSSFMAQGNIYVYGVK